MPTEKLLKAAVILLIAVLIVVILVFAKPFLVPVTFAALLAMLLVPISNWLQKRNINRALAAVLSILTLVTFFAIVFAFVAWQVSDLAEDASKIEQQVTERYQQVQEFVSTKLGISEEKQKEIINKQREQSDGAGIATSLLSGLGSMVTNALLILVYIFLFLYFRGQLERFVIRIVSKEDEKKAVRVLDRIQKVAQQYLSGMAQMIVGLWIMYGIAFTIIGVKNAVFFAVLCGLLEIVPFVGNLVGNGVTILMAVSQGGGTNMVIGILIAYGIIQFVQSYLLEPLIVGAEVNINPLFTIVGLVAGELIWGIPGMVIAIPLMGVLKIICDNVEYLRPYGELIGVDKKDDNKLLQKIKSLFKKKK